MFVFLLCVLTVATSVTSISLDDCPSGLTRDKYLQVYGDSCFRFELYEHRSYPSAERQCEKDGGTLALVKTKDVSNFIVRIMNTLGSTNRVWIGLNDDVREGRFVWEDGTPLEHGYSNWAFNNGPRMSIIMSDWEDCVALDPTDGGKWHDYHCKTELFLLSYDKPYVCEYKVQTTTTTVNVETPPPTTEIHVVDTQPPTAIQVECTELVCTLDCGMIGYRIGGDGCAICECDN